MSKCGGTISAQFSDLRLHPGQCWRNTQPEAFQNGLVICCQKIEFLPKGYLRCRTSRHVQRALLDDCDIFPSSRHELVRKVDAHDTSSNYHHALRRCHDEKRLICQQSRGRGSLLKAISYQRSRACLAASPPGELPLIASRMRKVFPSSVYRSNAEEKRAGQPALRTILRWVSIPAQDMGSFLPNEA